MVVKLNTPQPPEVPEKNPDRGEIAEASREKRLGLMAEIGLAMSKFEELKNTVWDSVIKGLESLGLPKKTAERFLSVVKVNPNVEADEGESPEPLAEASTNSIAQEVRKLIGRTDFRDADVEHGNKACAQVVSVALEQAGCKGFFKDRNNEVVDENSTEVLSVDHLEETLKENAWEEVPGPGQPGDVIIWRGTASNGKPIRHVGIMTGPNRVVANSSSKKMPRESHAGEDGEGFFGPAKKTYYRPSSSSFETSSTA